MYRHILIPDDGSPLSEKAVEHGIALAKSVGARITAITVTEPFHMLVVEPSVTVDTLEDYARHAAAAASRILDRISRTAKAAGVTCEVLHVEHEQPYQAVIDAAAARGCDLIVMASHGRRGMSALVIGSETTKVVTHSKIPVLVCR